MVDDEDDVFNEEFDVLDDEFEEEDADVARPAAKSAAGGDEEPAPDASKAAAEEDPPAPPTDHVVHVYEHDAFKRTIDREFTAEDAEAFATEYNRTAKSYGRFALAGKQGGKPKKTLS